MATHISNFGRMIAKLEQFADIHGFIPERGDKKEEFYYRTGAAWDETGFEAAGLQYDEVEAEAAWREWVEEAIAETEQASRAVAAWARDD